MEKFFLGQLAAWHHPSTTPTAKGRVLLVHGISEHSGRHLNTINWLTACGLEVVRFDLRGSGQSGGRKQWISKFGDYVDDTAAVFNWVNRTLPPLPLVVHGHSLGGAVATYFAAAYAPQIRLLSLSAPAYLVGSSISPLKIALGRLVAVVLPTTRLPNGGDFGAVSRDPVVVEAYEKDLLAHHFNTIQQGDQVLRGLEKMPDTIGRVTMPLLIVHGTDDRIIKPSGSFQLLLRAGSKDKELHYLPLGYHEPHNDLDKQEYFSLLSRWILARL